MRTVTFYSYKGGVGRTLALAQLAVWLTAAGRKVFALDFDLEAPGLHYKLKPTGGELSKGVVDLIHDFIIGAEPPESLADFVCRIPTGSAGAELHLMPAGRPPRASYWRRLAEISWHDLLYTEGAAGIPLVLEIKERIRREFAPDFLLIDARTGVTELGGIALSVLADDVVCLMAHNDESLEGARTVLRSVLAAERPFHHRPVRLLAVLARIPRQPAAEAGRLESVRGYLNEPAEDLARTLSIERLFVLHSEPRLELSESLLLAGGYDEIGSTLFNDYLSLFVQLLPQEDADALLASLSEGPTPYADRVHRLLPWQSLVPVPGPKRAAKWEDLLGQVRNLLAGDREAAAAIGGQSEPWGRALDHSGTDGLVKAIWERSSVDRVVLAMHAAHQALDGRPRAAAIVEKVLARILPALYDRRLVYRWPDKPGGVVLQIPAATSTLADVVMAGFHGRPLRYEGAPDADTFPQPTGRIGATLEAGIDLSGERAFEDFVEDLARTFVAEEDRRALGKGGRLDGQRLADLARLVNDELAWRAEHRADGVRRYFLFDSEFARDQGPFLARLRESLPALQLVQLVGDDLPAERRLCRPLRDLLYRSQSHGRTAE